MLIGGFMDRQELESSLYEIFRELLIRKESENTKVPVGMQNSLFVSSLNQKFINKGD